MKGMFSPLEQDVENLGVLMHESHSRAICIAVHSENAPTHLQHQQIPSMLAMLCSIRSRLITT